MITISGIRSSFLLAACVGEHSAARVGGLKKFTAMVLATEAGLAARFEGLNQGDYPLEIIVEELEKAGLEESQIHGRDYIAPPAPPTT